MSFSNRQLQAMLRDRRRLATGQPPRRLIPDSPLIRLLDAIPIAIRTQIRGVHLSPRLGYLAQHRFHDAEHLLKWLRPQREMLETDPWPAESYRDKRFWRQLFLDDLRTHAADARILDQIPVGLRSRMAALNGPRGGRGQ